MAKKSFGSTLKSNREMRGISRPALGMEGQLIRLEEGETKRPRKTTVNRIADALSNKASDNALERSRLLDELMRSAGHAENINEHIDRLKIRCVERLRRTDDAGWSEHEIHTIVDHLKPATLQRIATKSKKGLPTDSEEGLSVSDLNEIASELQDSSTKQLNQEPDQGSTAVDGRHKFRVGPVTIYIDKSFVEGQASPKVREMVEAAGQMIVSALNLSQNRQQ